MIKFLVTGGVALGLVTAVAAAQTIAPTAPVAPVPGSAAAIIPEIIASPLKNRTWTGAAMIDRSAHRDRDVFADDSLSRVTIRDPQFRRTEYTVVQ